MIGVIGIVKVGIDAEPGNLFRVQNAILENMPPGKWPMTNRQ